MYIKHINKTSEQDNKALRSALTAALIEHPPLEQPPSDTHNIEQWYLGDVMQK